MTSTLPPEHAQCIGVSRSLFLALTGASHCTRYSVVFACPRTADQCSGVLSSASFSCTFRRRPGPRCARDCARRGRRPSLSNQAPVGSLAPRTAAGEDRGRAGGHLQLVEVAPVGGVAHRQLPLLCEEHAGARWRACRTTCRQWCGHRSQNLVVRESRRSARSRGAGTVKKPRQPRQAASIRSYPVNCTLH